MKKKETLGTLAKKKRSLNNGVELNDDDKTDQDEMMETKLSIGDIRKIVEVDILWKGEPHKPHEKIWNY